MLEILFILFINDLPNGLSVLCKLFADDSKFMSVIRNPRDRDEFQSNINKILDWVSKWKMELNLSKCKVMHFGNNKIHQNRSYSFNLENKIHFIENTRSERDLGIIVQDNLKWNEHISTQVHKANFVLGKLNNAFKNWDLRTFKLLFTTYVRPILEYGATAWCSYRKHEIKQIENVQRRATKLVPTIRNKNYEERLKLLGMITLAERRERGDLIQFYKFENNFNKIDWFHLINQSPSSRAHSPAGSTRQQKKLYRQVVKQCSSRHHFYTNRMIPYWNDLPNDVKIKYIY